VRKKEGKRRKRGKGSDTENVRRRDIEGKKGKTRRKKAKFSRKQELTLVKSGNFDRLIDSFNQSSNQSNLLDFFNHRLEDFHQKLTLVKTRISTSQLTALTNETSQTYYIFLVGCKLRKIVNEMIFSCR
jgi:hypothetical protein